ncbi:hypothetical protein Hanom_Chr05g00415571 [Helianthus anomalus]
MCILIFALVLRHCTHVYSDFALFLRRCTHVYSDFCYVFNAMRRRKRGKWRWKVDKDDSRMRSIRMIHVCLFAWSIRMIQHITRRIVEKTMSFLFFLLCCVYCFHETGTCNCMFFFWFGKHYGNCYLFNIK